MVAAEAAIDSAVFVVDDDSSIREAIKSLLKSVGLYAETFASAEEFLSEARPDVPSCLVLDVKLPGVSGLEFQAQLNRIGVEIPIVFITAHGDIPSNVRALKAGAIEFLAKPFQKEELLGAVKQAIELDRAQRAEKIELTALQSRITALDTRERTAAFEAALLKTMATNLSTASESDQALTSVVEFVASVVQCDFCLLYTLEQDELVLRASTGQHAAVLGRVKIKIGQGITGWVAEHQQPVMVSSKAHEDPRFKLLADLPENRCESFLSVPLISGRRLVGVINLQNRAPHEYSRRETNLISTIGFLVGAEVERARLESENSRLTDQLETRKVMERAKGILQRDLKISEEDAYLTIQRECRQRRKPMREVADAIILSDELKNPR
jgi:FixJ family two-component response regulator